MRLRKSRLETECLLKISRGEEKEKEKEIRVNVWSACEQVAAQNARMQLH